MQIDWGAREGESPDLDHLHQPVHLPARQNNLSGGIQWNLEIPKF